MASVSIFISAIPFATTEGGHTFRIARMSAALAPDFNVLTFSHLLTIKSG